MDSIYLAIYRMPFALLAVLTVVILAAAAAAHIFLRKNVKRDVGGIAAIFAFLLVLYVTVLSRGEIVEDIVLMPGYSFSRAAHSEEYLRMVLMNIFLFVPFGASVSLAWGGKKPCKVIPATIGLGAILTVVIEAVQYFFRLGCAETDDVICNVLGTVIGLLPYIVTCGIVKRRNRT